MIALLILIQADVEIRQELSARAAALERSFHGADFENERPRLRDEYFYMLGLSPRPEKSPLRAKTAWRREFDTFVVEGVHFQSRPGLYVTANLYLPKTPGRHPAIVYQSGHSNMKRDGNKTAYQDHGIWFASHGYVCLVTDTLQLGEIGAIHHGTYRERRWWWHDRGYTPAGVEAWNAIRAIDFLQERPEVDPERIGATGISGGGAATLWVAAADERIKVAAPVSGMADLGYYVGQDGVNGHCDCMFFHNTFRWNWTTIAALVCPRPMAFVNSDNDGIFPMSANERVSNRLEHLYARYGVSDKFETIVSIGGHAYRTDLRRGIFEFFNRHFKHDARPVTDPDMGLAADGKTKRIPSAELRVFPADTDLPADPINAEVDELFVPLGKPGLPEEGKFNEWRDGLLAELRRVSFIDALPPLRPAAAGRLAILDDGPLPEGMLPDAMSYRLRGGWTIKNPPNTVERSFALLGQTADSYRLTFLVGDLSSEQRIAGRGKSGVIAAYAALLSGGASELTIIDPPASHKDGPHFLNVLRVLDIPEALGMLAPRKLTLINAKDPAFERTVEIYRRAGAADKIERK